MQTCKTKTEKAFINTTDTRWETRRSVNSILTHRNVVKTAKIQK